MSFKKTLLLEFTDFQNFPGPPTIFKDFPILENARLKFKYFPIIPGPVGTLVIALRTSHVIDLSSCHDSDKQTNQSAITWAPCGILNEDEDNDRPQWISLVYKLFSF